MVSLAKEKPGAEYIRQAQSYFGGNMNNQLAISGLETKGEKLKAQAEEWIKQEPDAWRYIVGLALDAYHSGGQVRMKGLIELMRMNMHRKISNAIEAPLSRMLIRDHPELESSMKLGTSMCDAYFLADE